MRNSGRSLDFAIKRSCAPNSALELSEAHESATMIHDASERVSIPVAAQEASGLIADVQ